MRTKEFYGRPRRCQLVCSACGARCTVTEKPLGPAHLSPWCVTGCTCGEETVWRMTPLQTLGTKINLYNQQTGMRDYLSRFSSADEWALSNLMKWYEMHDEEQLEQTFQYLEERMIWLVAQPPNHKRRNTQRWLGRWSQIVLSMLEVARSAGVRTGRADLGARLAHARAAMRVQAAAGATVAQGEG